MSFAAAVVVEAVVVGGGNGEKKGRIVQQTVFGTISVIF
jgi:hypothetical protein